MRRQPGSRTGRRASACCETIQSAATSARRRTARHAVAASQTHSVNVDLRPETNRRRCKTQSAQAAADPDFRGDAAASSHGNQGSMPNESVAATARMVQPPNEKKKRGHECGQPNRCERIIKAGRPEYPSQMFPTRRLHVSEHRHNEREQWQRPLGKAANKALPRHLPCVVPMCLYRRYR